VKIKGLTESNVHIFPTMELRYIHKNIFVCKI